MTDFRSRIELFESRFTFSPDMAILMIHKGGTNPMENVINKNMEQKTAQPNKKAFISFYTKGEEIFNAVSHIVGGALGVAAWIVLMLLAYPNGWHMLAVSAFSLSIIILYTMSALYHFLPNGRAKGVFRIFDHSTIFLLIAGTYTPYCLIALQGTAIGFWVLVVEWVCTVAGIAMTAIGLKNIAVKVINMVLYFTMGWLALVFVPKLFGVVSVSCLVLLLLGGVAYTAGIVFFALGRKKRWFHSIWHLFVLAGTILHFVSVLLMLI